MCHMAHSAALSLFCEKPFDDSDVIRVSEGFCLPAPRGIGFFYSDSACVHDGPKRLLDFWA